MQRKFASLILNYGCQEVQMDKNKQELQRNSAEAQFERINGRSQNNSPLLIQSKGDTSLLERDSTTLV